MERKNHKILDIIFTAIVVILSIILICIVAPLVVVGYIFLIIISIGICIVALPFYAIYKVITITYSHLRDILSLGISVISTKMILKRYEKNKDNCYVRTLVIPHNEDYDLFLKNCCMEYKMSKYEIYALTYMRGNNMTMDNIRYNKDTLKNNGVLCVLCKGEK